MAKTFRPSLFGESSPWEGFALQMGVWLHKYIYIYIYINISTYLHIYIFTYLYIYISTYLHIYISIYLYIYISTYLHIYISIYLYIYISIYLFLNMYIYIDLRRSISTCSDDMTQPFLLISQVWISRVPRASCVEVLVFLGRISVGGCFSGRVRLFGSPDSGRNSV